MANNEKPMSELSEGKRKEGGLAEGGRVILQAIVIALIIRTLAFEAFNIPSGSMKSTLLIGDYLFVSKYSYGYSHYSLPFSPPLFSGRIFAFEPQRGDVVVFRLPKDDSTDYIKRVIGLPGDHIQMKGGLLHINGTPVKRERVSDFIDDENGEHVRRWRETLPEGVPYPAPDRHHYVFVRPLIDNPSNWEIFLGDLEGSQPIQLTFKDGFNGFPSISPDGTKMLFARSEGAGFAGGLYTYVMDVSSLNIGPKKSASTPEGAGR
jgi:signal peptidase I